MFSMQQINTNIKEIVNLTSYSYVLNSFSDSCYTLTNVIEAILRQKIYDHEDICVEYDVDYGLCLAYLDFQQQTNSLTDQELVFIHNQPEYFTYTSINQQMKIPLRHFIRSLDGNFDKWLSGKVSQIQR